MILRHLVDITLGVTGGVVATAIATEAPEVGFGQAVEKFGALGLLGVFGYIFLKNMSGEMRQLNATVAGFGKQVVENTVEIKQATDRSGEIINSLSDAVKEAREDRQRMAEEVRASLAKMHEMLVTLTGEAVTEKRGERTGRQQR